MKLNRIIIAAILLSLFATSCRSVGARVEGPHGSAGFLVNKDGVKAGFHCKKSK